MASRSVVCGILISQFLTIDLGQKSTSISRVDALRLLRMTPPDDGLSQPTKPKQVIGFVDNSGHCHRIPAQSEIKPIGANHAIIPLPRMSPTLPAIGAVTQGQIYGLSHAAVAPSGPQTATRLIPVQLAEPAPPPAPSAYSSVAGPMQMPMPMTMTVPLPLAPSSFVVGGTVPPHMLGKPAMQPYYGMLPLSSSAGAPPTIYNPTQPSASPWHTQQSMADAVRPYDPGYGFMYAGAPQVFPYQQLQPQPLVQMQPSVQYQPASGVTAFAGGQYAVMVPR